MDPLSIVASVAGLIGLCTRAGLTIKSARDGAKIVDSKIDLLDSEIRGYMQVLELMKSTMEDVTLQNAFQSTGHIGNHWKNIYAATDDSHQTLEQLNQVLIKVEKSVSVLDSTRKHFRLKFATDEIEMYQRKIKTYHDTMKMSIQTVILWNQVSHHESTDKILPGLDDLSRSIRDLAIDLNVQMASLRTTVESTHPQSQLQTLDRMKSCVQTSADVVSSASTTLRLDDRATVVAPSELGDIFGSRIHESVMRWMDDDLEGGQHEGPDASRPSPYESVTYIPAMSSLTLADSDSDGEIERELIEAHLKRGREERKRERMPESIRYLERALARVRRYEQRFVSTDLKIDVLEELLAAYLDDTDLNKAKDVALERLQLLSRSYTTSGQDDSENKYLVQALLLGNIFSQLGDPTQARIYAKKCIKGYRKVGKTGRPDLLRSIALMVSACRAAGDGDEGDAYKLMLDDLSAAIQEEENEASKNFSRRRRPTTPSDSDFSSGIRLRLTAEKSSAWRRRHDDEGRRITNTSNNELQSHNTAPVEYHRLGTGEQRDEQLRPSPTPTVEASLLGYKQEELVRRLEEQPGEYLSQQRETAPGPVLNFSLPVGEGKWGGSSLDIYGGQLATATEETPPLPLTEGNSAANRRRRRREERRVQLERRRAGEVTEGAEYT